MTNRELLERCAKVMNLTPARNCKSDLGLLLPFGDGVRVWNPLTNLSDAADMAIRMKVDVWWSDDKSGCIADADGIGKPVIVSFKDHPTEQVAYCYAVCSVVAQMGDKK